jgi:hypothetical protein
MKQRTSDYKKPLLNGKLYIWFRETENPGYMEGAVVNIASQF